MAFNYGVTNGGENKRKRERERGIEKEITSEHIESSFENVRKAQLVQVSFRRI